MEPHPYHSRSRMVHGSFDNPSWNFSDPVAMPISTSTTFRLGSTTRGAQGFQEFAAAETPEEPIYVYQRLDDPCVASLEARLADAEGGDMAVCFASGMAAIAAALGVTLQSGDHLVCHRTVYGCTHSLISRWLERQGVSHTFVDFNDRKALEGALRPNTRALYFETPCNPNLEIVDIQAVCNLARARGLATILDNTFSTPFGQRGIELGVDVVVHSLTKGISGFGTEMGGVVVGPKAMQSDLLVYRKDFGGVLSPQTAWHILNYGLPTLSMRTERQQRNSMAVAEFLERHPAVGTVRYPGLRSFPQRDLAMRQMRDFDGMFAPGTLIAFELAGDDPYGCAVRMMDWLAANALCVTLAVSLGQVRTLIEHPASMTHSALTPEERREAGIAEGAIRLSLGIEDANDIMQDLAQALAAAYADAPRVASTAYCR